MKVLLLFVALVGFAGCKALVPYDSKFACEGTQDFGRCMDVQSAYEDALGTQSEVQRRDKSGAAAPKWEYRNGNQKGAISSPTRVRISPARITRSLAP